MSGKLPKKSPRRPKTAQKSGRNSSRSASRKVSHEIPLPPVWSNDIANEKWTAKAPWEDPDGLPALPMSVATRVKDWVRPADLLGEDVEPAVHIPVMRRVRQEVSRSSSRQHKSSKRKGGVGGSKRPKRVTETPTGEGADTPTLGKRKHKGGDVERSDSPADGAKVTFTDYEEYEEEAPWAMNGFDFSNLTLVGKNGEMSIPIVDDAATSAAPSEHAGDTSDGHISEESDIHADDGSGSEVGAPSEHESVGSTGTQPETGSIALVATQVSLAETGMSDGTLTARTTQEEGESMVAEDEPPLTDRVTAAAVAAAQRTHSNTTDPHEVGWFMWLASVLKGVADLGAAGGVGDAPLLWRSIYPQTKDGRPTVSPMGKYCVRLFFDGEWRKVFVDDRIPIDRNGAPLLLPSTVARELWPLLICKALCKLVTQYGAYVYPDTAVVTWLTGFMPHLIPTTTPLGMWRTLSDAVTSKRLVMCGCVSESFLPSLNPSLLSEATPRAPQLQPFDNTDEPYLITRAGFHVPLIKVHNEKSGQSRSSRLVGLASFKDPHAKRKRRSRGLAATATFLGDSNASAFSRNGRLSARGEGGMDSGVSVRSSRSVIGESEGRLRGVSNGFAWMDVDEFNNYFNWVCEFYPPADYGFSADVAVGPDAHFDDVTLLTYAGASEPVRVALWLTAPPDNTSPTANALTSVHIEPYDWREAHGGGLAVTASVTTTTTNSTLFTLPEGDGGCWRIVADGPPGTHVSVLTSAAVTVGPGAHVLPLLGAVVETLEGNYAAAAGGEWTVWARVVFSVDQMLRMSVRLSASEAAAAAHARVRLIDQTTATVETAPLTGFPARVYKPHASGKRTYTLLVDCGTAPRDQAFDGGKWKLRLVSDKSLASVELDPPRFVEELSGVYAGDKYHTLFRYVVRCKDAAELVVRLACGLPETEVRVTVLHEGEPLLPPVEGKGVVFIPHFQLDAAPELQSKSDSRHGRASVDQTASAEDVTEGVTRVIVVGEIINDSWVPPPTPPTTTPTPGPVAPSRSERSAKEKKKKKGGRKTSSRSPMQVPAEAGGMLWTLMVVSTASVEVRPDTAKEDRLAGIRSTWESKQPGRASKARALRERYLIESGNEDLVTGKSADKHAGSGGKRRGVAASKKGGSGGVPEKVAAVAEEVEPIPPEVINSAAPNAPHVLTMSDEAERAGEKAKNMAVYQNARSASLDYRANERNERNELKEVQADNVDALITLATELRTDDWLMREELREKLAEEARLAAEAAPPTPLEKSRKGGPTPRKRTKSPRGRKRAR